MSLPMESSPRLRTETASAVGCMHARRHPRTIRAKPAFRAPLKPVGALGAQETPLGRLQPLTLLAHIGNDCTAFATQHGAVHGKSGSAHTPADRAPTVAAAQVVQTEVTKKQPDEITALSREGAYVNGLYLEGAPLPAVVCPGPSLRSCLPVRGLHGVTIECAHSAESCRRRRRGFAAR